MPMQVANVNYAVSFLAAKVTPNTRLLDARHAYVASAKMKLAVQAS